MNENIKRSAITDVVVKNEIIKGEWIRIGDEAMLIEQRFNPYTRKFQNYLNEELVKDPMTWRIEFNEEVVGAIFALGIFSFLIAVILTT